MADHSSCVERQLSHPLVSKTAFTNLDEYIISLMHQRAYEVVADLMGGMSVLDLGCNDGHGTAFLADHVAQVSGLDVSAAAVTAAKARLKGTSARVELYDGVRSSFPKDAFDAIVSFQVLEHIEDYDAYFAEIKRVLRPGGFVVFTTPNAAIRLLPSQRPWNPYHVREFRAAELAELLGLRFPRVEIQGLFGLGPVHDIELARCARLRDASALKPSTRTRLRQMLHTRIPFLSRLRGERDSSDRRPGPFLSKMELARFSTSDFEYRSTGLDDALDLMAVCRLADA